MFTSVETRTHDHTQDKRCCYQLNPRGCMMIKINRYFHHKKRHNIVIFVALNPRNDDLKLNPLTIKRKTYFIRKTNISVFYPSIKNNLRFSKNGKNLSFNFTQGHK